MGPKSSLRSSADQTLGMRGLRSNAKAHKSCKYLLRQLTDLAVITHCSVLALGFTNGTVRVLDALSLQEEGRDEGMAIFSHCHDSVTHIVFSHDSTYLATAVSVTL